MWLVLAFGFMFLQQPTEVFGFDKKISLIKMKINKDENRNQDSKGRCYDLITQR